MVALPWFFGKLGPQRLALLWRGRDPTLFLHCVNALRDLGIPFERTHVRGYEAVPPSLERSALFSMPFFEIRVPSQDLSRARQVLQQLLKYPAAL